MKDNLPNIADTYWDLWPGIGDWENLYIQHSNIISIFPARQCKNYIIFFIVTILVSTIRYRDGSGPFSQQAIM
jgi:hypothetical protein